MIVYAKRGWHDLYEEWVEAEPPTEDLARKIRQASFFRYSPVVHDNCLWRAMWKSLP